MKKIKLMATALCFTLMFTAFAACDEVSRAYWQTDVLTYEDEIKRENFVRLNFSPTEKYEVWADISDLEEDDSAIDFAAGYSTSYTNSKTTVTLTKNLLKESGGWVRLQTNISSSYSYIDIGTRDAMKINEIVICSVEKGEVFAAKLYKAGYRISRSSSSNVHEFTDEEYENMKNGPANVCDEQATIEFERAKVLAAYETALNKVDPQSQS